MPRQSSLSHFELMVMLAVTRAGEEAYGVPVSREIEACTGKDVTLGSVYAALERLERRQLVKSSLGEATPERGGRAKRYFRVTPRGLRRVQDARRSLTTLWDRIPALEGGTA